ncbi:DNA-binding helix-turn-helix protein [Leptospira santarosai str. HAI821]|nr:DNA-binding helix-turn-helix protein [Leptospira santarosai str. HAI821]
MNFSEVLKSLMSRQGWNQEDLAKAGEVKQPTVSRYLSGRSHDSDVDFCGKSLQKRKD